MERKYSIKICLQLLFSLLSESLVVDNQIRKIKRSWGLPQLLLCFTVNLTKMPNREEAGISHSREISPVSF